MPLVVKFLVALCLSQIVNAGVYTNRFLQQYKKIHNSANGYFSKEGIPYHAVETLIVEAPDHGHETTSEAYSYYVWLEAMYGAIKKDFSSFNKAWDTIEKYIIPTHADQPTNNFYNPSKPATYAAEWDTPDQYPSQIRFDVPVGQDPLYQELVNAYGNSDVYSMHWLSDVDNVYGFGNAPGTCSAGPSTKGPSYINTFQRGPMESVWRTIPQPTCDNFNYGGRNGFLDLFVKDNSYTRQWKFTAAPDADARAIQATYWAYKWASAHGQASQVSGAVAKAAKMGDYLRYSLFDKYFKKVGNCIGESNCPGGWGKDSAHYLISWYFAWGGSLNGNGGWAWRIGDGASHFGYQNPLTAYVLSHEQAFKPKGSTAAQDWQTSLGRQLELYKWLQSAQGAFSGGVTNSWKGRYADPESYLKSDTFHGMFYDWEPVYHNPPSNRWYGMQPWSADRLAQYYYVTGDNQAKQILDRWIQWIVSEIKFNGNNYRIPDQLEWNGSAPRVSVIVKSYTSDVGSASATARTLSYYAAKSGNQTVKYVAKKLLDGIWAHQTRIGVSLPEVADTYKQFNEKVYVPPGWTGKYPNGDAITSDATFIKIRSFYKKDPNWHKVEAYLKGGAAPSFTFHRFWSQSDVALAQGTYGLLFNE